MARKKKGRGKKILFKLIEQFNGHTEPYATLHRLVRSHHAHLVSAKIALAWKIDTKRDTDGLLILGLCKKSTDLDRELMAYDFVILLNKEAWEDLSLPQREALLDHELCHAQVAKGKDGDPKRDERDRLVYRIRKHDIEEFREIVERHGCYKADLEEFARACIEQRRTPLFDAEPTPQPDDSLKFPA